MAIEELVEWAVAHSPSPDDWGDRLFVLLGDAVAGGFAAQRELCQTSSVELDQNPIDRWVRRQDGQGHPLASPQIATVLEP